MNLKRRKIELEILEEINVVSDCGFTVAGISHFDRSSELIILSEAKQKGVLFRDVYGEGEAPSGPGPANESNWVSNGDRPRLLQRFRDSATALVSDFFTLPVSAPSLTQTDFVMASTSNGSELAPTRRMSGQELVSLRLSQMEPVYMALRLAGQEMSELLGDLLITQAEGKNGGGGQMGPEGRGYIDIVVWPEATDLGNAITEENEQQLSNPYGVFINVNWDDDDNDRWTNNAQPPNAACTPDKDDDSITWGDNDLFYTRLYVYKGPADQGAWNGSVTVTYGTRIKIYESETKSGLITSGTAISVNDMTQDPQNALIRYKEVFIEGVTASVALRDTDLNASYAGTMQMIPGRTTDEVEFSVLEVALTGQFAYGNQNSNLIFSEMAPPASSDHTGMISWDDADGNLVPDAGDPNCQYFRNCVEITGTISPSLQPPPPPPEVVFPELLDLSFDIKRDRQVKIFTKLVSDATWGTPTTDDPAWTGDDTGNSDEQLIPNDLDKIYVVDAPGVIVQTINTGDKKELVSWKANYIEYVKVSLYGRPAQQCSAFLNWKAQIYLKEKVSDPGKFTRDGGAAWNQSGTGWLANMTDPNNHN